jgi:magnesium chelatase family protein
MLDRIDIHVEVPRVEYEKLSDERLGEPSENVRERVEASRQRQRERFEDSDLTCNADMRPGDIRAHCQLDDAGRALIKSAMSQLQLSARAYHRVLKLGRTIADLAGSAEIQPAQLAEALQYRPRNLVGV